MEAVSSRFTAKYPKAPVRAQQRGMNAAAREKFIAAFAAEDNRLLVGFCVLGGSFSEGIDLPGRALIGTIIVASPAAAERGAVACWPNITRTSVNRAMPTPTPTPA